MDYHDHVLQVWILIHIDWNTSGKEMLTLVLPSNSMGILSLDKCVNLSLEHCHIYMLLAKFSILPPSNSPRTSKPPKSDY